MAEVVYLGRTNLRRLKMFSSNGEILADSRRDRHVGAPDLVRRLDRWLDCQEPDALSHPQGTQIRISRQEISRIVGCSREMVGRVLKQLEEQDKISVKGKTIVVFGTRG